MHMQDFTTLDKTDRVLFAVEALSRRLDRVSQETARVLLHRLAMQSAKEWSIDKEEYREMCRFLIEWASRERLI